MKLAAVLFLCVCAAPLAQPVVNIPVACRQSNWTGPQGEGSCVWATMTSLLRWQGRTNTAEHIRHNYGDGTGWHTLCADV